MGLFSKLFNDPRSGEEALDFLKNAAREVMNEAASKMNDAQPASRREPATPVAPTRPASGFSWGGEMPAEENQFSFAGSYVQYFEMIFREDFPAYRVDTQAADADRFTVFTLWDGGRQALVVEVKSEKSAAQKIRRACEANGVPYLRFYFDHRGWWNTRSYVTERVRLALNG